MNINKNRDDDIVVVSAVRTPLCRSKKGALKDVVPSTLFQTVLEGLLEQTTQQSGGLFTPKDIDDICVGNVLMPASGFAAMRMAQLMAGIPETTSLQMVNRQCSSGLQAVVHIVNAIATDQIRIGIGAGVESMSSFPMSSIEAPPMDWDSIQQSKYQKVVMDCLLPMGITSENVVKKYGLHRTELDTFAAMSHQKAAMARKQNKFQNEIIPVGAVSNDDGIRPQTTVEILSKLRPVFDKKHGVTTAGNSSQTTDGAAAVLLMKRKEAVQRHLPIMGIWKGYAVQGVPPRIMGIGPAVAIPAVLEQVGLSTSDIDIYEINEAFASQAYWCIQQLQIDPNKVNPNGGAIALGHPLGCTGARMIATLLHEMNRTSNNSTTVTKKRYGVVSMCIGTGMGAAAVLEVEPVSSL